MGYMLKVVSINLVWVLFEAKYVHKTRIGQKKILSRKTKICQPKIQDGGFFLQTLVQNKPNRPLEMILGSKMR